MPSCVHARHQQSVGLDHDLRVRGLHRQHDVVVVVLAGDAHELERRLDHARRRIAVAVHDAVGQGAVIGADAHGDAAVLALEHQRREALFDAIDLRGVVLVRILARRGRTSDRRSCQG